MNKFVLIGVGALVVVGVAIFILNPFGKSSENQSKTSTDSSQKADTASNSKSIKGTLKDLFARGISMECTFNRTDEVGITSGKVYLAGKKMRGEFESQLRDGQNLETSVIRNEKYSYTWNSSQPQGTKIKIEDPDTLAEDSTSNEKQVQFALDDDSVNYNCKPWNADNSMFVPPTDIEFVDLSVKTQEIKEAVEKVQENKCAACDALPAGPSKDQCLQSLGCE